jgi:hypothetical protein
LLPQKSFRFCVLQDSIFGIFWSKFTWKLSYS